MRRLAIGFYFYFFFSLHFDLVNFVYDLRARGRQVHCFPCVV